MKIAEIIGHLESIAPRAWQEEYDNAGLIVGNPERECSGIVVSLDVTKAVVMDAVAKKANLIVAHHPIVFGGLKKINGNGYVEKTVIAAIKNDVAIYAIHTNLDNTTDGVNARIADMLGLEGRKVLRAMQNVLRKLAVHVPDGCFEKVRRAIFDAGAGHISRYSECSFSYKGTGTFRPGAGADPFEGRMGERSEGEEWKMEFVYPPHLENNILAAMKNAHDYEEVAYDILPLRNATETLGAGLIGRLKEPMETTAFLRLLKVKFGTPAIKHTSILKDKVQKIAVCGGAGSFLTKTAIAAGADVFVTADVKYHGFFDADGHLVLADIGHFESEQYTQDLLCDTIRAKFPKFAVQKTGICTNPVAYFI